jgi:hypothetical protein
MHRENFKLKSAAYPGIMAGVSFAIFIAIYYHLTQRVIKPHYYMGLLFAVPSLCFAAIAYWSARHTGEEQILLVTGTLTIFLGFVFGLMALITVSCTLINDATANVTDVGSYDRVMKLSCFQQYLIADFPDKLPADAENTKLYYSPFAIGQGGQKIAVGFQARTDTIDSYIEIFSREAIWIGKENSTEAHQYGVFTGEFSCLEGSSSGLPRDYKVYVTSCKPYSVDWNHGENSLVAISKERNEILFLASKW